MSGENARAEAGVAKATASAHRPTPERKRRIIIEVTEPAGGPEYEVTSPTPIESRRPRGRPKLTEAKVRDELMVALEYLRTRPDNPTDYPTWDAIAAAHSGYSEDETPTQGGLRHRRERFPDVFRELVPHLTEGQ